MTSLVTTETLPVSPLDLQDSADAQVRLTLLAAAPGGRMTTLDGAWWPHSRSLTDELPALITELHRRDLRITRVVYNPESWDPAPRRLRADGRIVRLGWFRSIDPNLVYLTGNYGDNRVELLVVPPDTAPAASALAMTRAASPGNRSTPTAVLTAADLETDLADLSDAMVWESEGGHLHR